MGKERRPVTPGERRIRVADRDRHDRNTDPLRDSETSAVKCPDATIASRGALGEIEDGDARSQQRVHAPQHARARERRLALDEHDAERCADRADERPVRDLALCQRGSGAVGKQRERIEVADVIRDDQCPPARDLAANGDGELVGTCDRAEGTSEPMRRLARVARRSHASRTELREGVEQAASGVAASANELEADHA